MKDNTSLTEFRPRFFDRRILFIAVFTLLLLIIVAQLRSIPQKQTYHHFSDNRTLWGVPNFENVISNLPFLLVGLSGIFWLRKVTATRSGTDKKLKPVFIAQYACLFLGIILTGIGSALYHIHPDDEMLVYDRLPMTIVFMSVLAATFSEVVNERMGSFLLLPLILLGMGSVAWWKYTADGGIGDLRWYGVVQYYPLVLIPVLLVLFPTAKADRGISCLILAVLFYLVAKCCEYYDGRLFLLTGFISGHTLKHFFCLDLYPLPGKAFRAQTSKIEEIFFLFPIL